MLTSVRSRPSSRKFSRLRLLAAALAGGIGAFGIPSSTHTTPTPPAKASAPPSSTSN